MSVSTAKTHTNDNDNDDDDDENNNTDGDSWWLPLSSIIDQLTCVFECTIL